MKGRDLLIEHIHRYQCLQNCCENPMRHYQIQSHPAADYVTGTSEKDGQVLMGLIYPHVAAAFFNISGQYLELHLRPLRFHAKSIRRGGPYLIEDPEFQDHLLDQYHEWQDEIGFTENTIRVDRFCLEVLPIGIEDLPRHFQEFLDDPDDFTEEEQREFPELIKEWTARGDFVLWWGTNYYLCHDGEISKPITSRQCGVKR